MSTRKRGLGRGLEALLGGGAGGGAALTNPVPIIAPAAAPVTETQAIPDDQGDPNPEPSPVATAQPGDQAPDSPTRTPAPEPPPRTPRTLPIDRLERGPFQARTHLGEEGLRELADSILAQGVLQPILVRRMAENRYQILAGERRWRACQLAGLKDIPVIIRTVDDSTAMAIGLIENLQREDLNPLEQSLGLRRLLDEFGLTHQSLAQALGKSRVTITNLLRLQELNEDVKNYLMNGDLELGHAKVLLGLSGPEQSQAARLTIAKGLSVRETEALVRKLKEPEGPTNKRTPPVDSNVRLLQEELSQHLGAQVKIEQKSKGKGRLVIAYDSLDQLDGILEKIR